MNSLAEAKALALHLRKQGRSYSEILKEIPVSRSTLSLWCRDVSLGEAQQQRLYQLLCEGASRARTHWNAVRKEQKQQLLEKIAQEARLDIGTLSQRDRFIAGLMLYAGEGERMQERVGMTNSDPILLRFALDWFCEFLPVDRNRFTAHLYLHRGRNENSAKRYWAQALAIDLSQFRKSYRPEQRSLRSNNIHIHGICAIRRHDRMSHRKIMGWMRAVFAAQ